MGKGHTKCEAGMKERVKGEGTWETIRMGCTFPDDQQPRLRDHRVSADDAVASGWLAHSHHLPLSLSSSINQFGIIFNISVTLATAEKEGRKFVISSRGGDCNFNMLQVC